MKDSKYLVVILLTIVFLLVFTLIFTLGYDYYSTRPSGKDDHGVSYNITHDSLQKIYRASVNNLHIYNTGVPVNTDTSYNNTDSLLAAYYKLKSEIDSLLNIPHNRADLDIAMIKIGELQLKVRELNNRNKQWELETMRLTSILQQLRNEKPGSHKDGQGLFQSASLPISKAAVVNNRSFLSIQELNLSAVPLKDEGGNEINEAVKTEKIVGSFTVKNTGDLKQTSEMIIVILQPDGKTLQKSIWESGTFETSEGRMIYSCKVQVENNGGEEKRLVFSLNSENYQKGIYILQIYHDGSLVGKMVKNLT